MQLLFSVLFAVTFAGMMFFYLSWRRLNSESYVLDDENKRLTDELEKLRARFDAVLSVEAEKQRVINELQGRQAHLQDEITRAEVEKSRAAEELETEKQRVAKELEAGKQQALLELDKQQRLVAAQLEAERNQKRAEVEAELSQLRGDVSRMRGDHHNFVNYLEEMRRAAEAEKLGIQSTIATLKEEAKILEEASDLRSFGYYTKRYDFETSERYQVKINEIRERQKWMLKHRTAAVCHTEWQVNGSRAAGQKQTNQLLRLMLRAFNGECEAAVAKARYNNAKVMEARILKAYETINKHLGKSNLVF